MDVGVLQTHDSNPFLKIPTAPLVKENKRKAIHIAKIMHGAFNDGELRELMHGLGVEYEDIKGDTRRDTVINISEYYRRHNLLGMFVEQLRVERPGYDWPVIEAE